jgi:hypothetical protein
MVYDKMVNRSAARRGKSTEEIIFLRYKTQFETIDKAHDKVLYGNGHDGNNPISQITDLLMQSEHRHVKHAAANALYALMNNGNRRAADSAEKELEKAMAKGSEYTRAVAIKYIRRTLMNDIRNIEVKDETRAEIEEARSRTGNILKSIFEIEDCNLQQISNSIILRGIASKIPTVVEITKGIINPYLPKKQDGSANDLFGHYKTLNVPTGATKAQINEAHKRLVLKYKSDNEKHESTKKKTNISEFSVALETSIKENESKIKELDRARMILGDTNKRKEYDEKFNRQQARSLRLMHLLNYNETQARSFLRT